MCLIIENKSRSYLFDIVSEKIVLKQLENNPDGFGITYFDIKENYIKTVKGFECKDFLNELHLIESNLSNCYYIHFRKATVGEISLDNAHPFDVLGDGSLFLMHNGTLPLFKDNQTLDTKNSDTYFLSQHIKLIINKHSFSYIHTQEFKTEVELILGNGRAVLIHSQGSILLNEKLWISVYNKLLFSKDVN